MDAFTPDTPTESSSSADAGALPSLPIRLVQVFTSPGALTDRLAEHPRWLWALLVSAGLVVLSMALVPAEIFLEAQRQAVLEAGGEFPEMPERALTVMRIVIPSLAGVSTFVFSFVFAGLYTVIFAFILGDEGSFRQYLAVLAHSWFIAALFGLLVTPLRISTENPQFTVNVASFFAFLPDGYFLNVLRALDVSQIWSTLVFARGAHAIDERRSVGSAAAIALTVLLAFAMIAAIFMP